MKQGQLVIQRIGTRCFGSYKSFTGNEVLPTLHLDEELAEVLGWIVGDINSSSCPNSITTYYPGGNSTLVERHRKIWQSHLGEVSVSEPSQGLSQKMTISSK